VLLQVVLPSGDIHKTQIDTKDGQVAYECFMSAVFAFLSTTASSSIPEVSSAQVDVHYMNGQERVAVNSAATFCNALTFFDNQPAGAKFFVGSAGWHPLAGGGRGGRADEGEELLV